MMHPPSLDSPPPSGPGNDLLDLALRAALAPPELPASFIPRLRAAWQREQETDFDARRAALQKQYEHELQELRQGQVRLRLQTLALVAGASFAGGALAVAALPWLQQWLGADAGLLMPSLAMGLGAVVGLGSWAWQAGRLRSIAGRL